MKIKKNGFIATSIVFSFFMVFSMLAIMVLASYAHYRYLLNGLNSSILNDLNENVITRKYISLDNQVINGDFESSDGWILGNSSLASVEIIEHEYNPNCPDPFDPSCSTDAYAGKYSLRMKKTDPNDETPTTLYFEQKINNIPFDGKTHKIYVAFRLFRNDKVICGEEVVDPETGTISYQPSDSYHGRVKLVFGGRSYNVADLSLEGDSYTNWILVSDIITVSYLTETDQKIVFEIENQLNAAYTFIDNVIVSDVTHAYKDGYYGGDSDAKLKSYLDSNLPFFKNNYVIPRQ